MPIVHAEHFAFENKQYEVRVVEVGDVFEIAVFRDNHRANGYQYSVSRNTSYDFRKIAGISGLQNMIEMAKTDVREKTWEKFLEALKRLADDEKDEKSQTE